jgi:hypothetical protein
MLLLLCLSDPKTSTSNNEHGEELGSRDNRNLFIIISEEL